MARNPDARKAKQPSSLCKYRRDETAEMRHTRRLMVALEQRSINALRGWCERQGLKLRITGDDDDHWMIRGKTLNADWWPRTAKLVINRRWEDGIHAHDVGQVIAELKSALEATK